MLSTKTPNYCYYFALYSFEAQQSEDLEFRSGDLLEVIAPQSVDDNWVKVKNPRTGKSGMAPRNYLTTEEGYSAALDAFNKVDRDASVTLLKSAGYKKKFNYIIRPSTDSRVLALSVLLNTGEVVHFKIHFDPSQQNCFIYSAKTFDTIEDLIIYYMDTTLPGASTLQAYRPFRMLSQS
ncbi:hypothetical protein Aperf_G00000126468 [Anoplocephala perfoliata]